MLGTFAVGKTSLVRRFVHNLFDDHYKSTLGVQIFQKTVKIQKSDAPIEVNMVLWDLANIEKMTPAIENYFRGASAALIVFDVTRPETFNLHDIHISNFQDINPKARLLFAANKSDLLAADTHIPDALQKITQQFQTEAIATSAKNGAGVEELFIKLAEKVGNGA